MLWRALTAIDSLVSSQVYEIVKTIYSSTAHETTEEGRIKVLQSTLGQLRLNNIATLDAVMTHFTRLIDLTSADEAYVSSLAQTLAPCILRPRVESSLTMNERHSYRLIRDLFDHKEAIFGELKRQSSAMALGAGSGQARPRAISTDESNRRAAMEARNRAIADRSRANSPASSNRHRRDRSTGGSESTRFPINFGSPVSRSHTRQSLEVPGSNDSSPAVDHVPSSAASKSPFQSIDTVADTPTNGASEQPAADSHQVSSVLEEADTGTVAGPGSRTGSNPDNDSVGDGDSTTPTTASAAGSAPVDVAGASVVEKRNSLTRGGAAGTGSGRYSITRKTGLARSSVASIGTPGSTASNRSSIAESVGELKPVTLEDKPMDD